MDIKLIVIACSILAIATDRLIPKEHSLYKVVNYAVRGVILILIGIYLYSKFLYK